MKYIKCESCGTSVDEKYVLGPHCPFCGEKYSESEKKSPYILDSSLCSYFPIRYNLTPYVKHGCSTNQFINVEEKEEPEEEIIRCPIQMVSGWDHGDGLGIP